jgi:hypothetical protein
MVQNFLEQLIVTVPYYEPDESCLQLHTLFFHYPF